MIRINQIKNFFKKKNQFSLRCSDYNIFRLFKLNQFKNKKVLDIGYRNGENLIEFDKRGAIPFGISLVDYKKYLKNFLSNYSTNNFFHLDLNRNSLTKCLEKSENLSGATRIRINKQTKRERERELGREIIIKIILEKNLMLLYALIQFIIFKILKVFSYKYQKS